MKAILRSLVMQGSLVSVICAAVAIALFVLLWLLQYREVRDKGRLVPHGPYQSLSRAG